MSRNAVAGPFATGALTALLSAGCVTAEDLPAPEVSYSADLSIKTSAAGRDAAGFEASGRSYYADGKRRRELRTTGGDAVVIERQDLGVRWSLEPGTEAASETPIELTPRGAAPDPARSWRRDAKFEKRGREEVNGVLADRYEVTAKSGSGTAWLTEQKVPVRYEGTFRDGGPEARVRLDFTNIQVGPQDPGLFELPEGVEPRPKPIGTHGPGTDRKRLQEKLRRERTGAQ